MTQIEWFAVCDYTRKDTSTLYRGTSVSVAGGYHRLGTTLGRSFTSADAAERLALAKAERIRRRLAINKYCYRIGNEAKWDDGAYIGGCEFFDGLLRWRVGSVPADC